MSMTRNDDLVETYLRWQQLLARYGATELANDAFLQLADQIERDPFLDSRGFEAVLDRLHVAAFPNASTRPPRLQAEQLETFLED
jgi:hypothetical protein